MKNGKLEPDSYEVQEFLLLKKYQRTNGISKLSDIYSIGAIMFKLLLGRAPTQHISKYIAEHNLQDLSATNNVYEIPYFFKDFILSNDMCQIIVKLIHENPQHRYQSIYHLREDLVQLRENIL